MNPATIIVLHGEIPPDAPPDEQDALVEVASISATLRALGYDVQAMAIGLDLADAARRLTAARPDLVFNLVETIAGRGNLLHLAPVLLDHLRIPYTGAPSEAIYTTSNKLLAKRMLHGARISTPAWASSIQESPTQKKLRPPYIIKSLWEHASVGLSPDSIIRDDRPIAAELTARAPSLGGACFAEGFVDGREFNLSLLAGPKGPEVLPPAEIRFIDFGERPKIVDYKAKWVEDSFECKNTVRSFDFPASDRALLQTLRRLCLRCWELFSLRGYARVDFRVAHDNTPFVLEINANPCISPDAGFCAAAQKAGLSPNTVVQRILDDTTVVK
jgi:D-alanine-D-alanine ligase